MNIRPMSCRAMMFHSASANSWAEASFRALAVLDAIFAASIFLCVRISLSVLVVLAAVTILLIFGKVHAPGTRERA